MLKKKKFVLPKKGESITIDKDLDKPIYIKKKKRIKEK